MIESNEENESVNDLGSWLSSLGAPQSITDLMPSEIAGLDIAPLLSLFNGIVLNGSALMESAMRGSELGGVGVKGGLRDATGGKTSTDAIRWLPVIRS